MDPVGFIVVFRVGTNLFIAGVKYDDPDLEHSLNIEDTRNHLGLPGSRENTLALLWDNRSLKEMNHSSLTLTS